VWGRLVDKWEGTASCTLSGGRSQCGPGVVVGWARHNAYLSKPWHLAPRLFIPQIIASNSDIDDNGGIPSHILSDMVLQDLGRRINAAVSDLTRSANLDEKVRVRSGRVLVILTDSRHSME
jgi:hypothetical protein